MPPLDDFLIYFQNLKKSTSQENVYESQVYWDNKTENGKKKRRRNQYALWNI